MPEAPDPLFAIPDGEAVALKLAPRKTSWDRSQATSQKELARYLDHAQRLAAPALAALSGALALRLDVGLADGIDPLFEHDLDNFLHPLIKRLGGERFACAWATKAPGARSYLRVEPARAAAWEDDWQRWLARTTVSSANENAWKDVVKAALEGARELAPGPVGLQVSFTVGPGRSWLNLWKLAIDGLDPLLGRSFPDDEYDPKDGRVVRLGMHVRVDPAVGWNTVLAIRARPAPLDWPELAWLAAMTETERDAWLAEHERRCTPTRRSRRRARQVRPARSQAVPPALATSTAPARGRAAGPVEICELTSIAGFRDACAGGLPIIITDSAKPPKLHRSPGTCPGVQEHRFELKVLVNGGRNGRYHQAGGEAAARARWPHLEICRTCR
jgi:hypothetical protein